MKELNYEESVKAIEVSKDHTVNDKLTWLLSAVGNLLSQVSEETNSEETTFNVNGAKGFIQVKFLANKK